MSVFDAQGIEHAPVRTVLDKGLYLATVQKVEGELSSKKQTPGLKVILQIASGPVQSNGGSPSGKIVFDDIWISAEPGAGRDIGLGKVKKLCLATDVEPNSKLELNNFTNKQVVVKIAHEEDLNGEPKEKVADYKHA